MVNKGMHSLTGPMEDEPASIPRQVQDPATVPVRVTPGPISPPVHSAAPDAMGLFRAFRRRWLVALGAGVLLGAMASVVAWYGIPDPKYTAESLLLVEPEQPRLIAATKEYRADPETDRKTQVTLIKSPVVLAKALSQPHVAGLEILRRESDASEWLESKIQAEFSGKILRLTLSGENPSELTTIMKAVTSAYLSEVAYKEKAQRLERNETLKDHYNKLQKQLEAKRGELKALAIELGSNDKQTLSLQQRLAMTQQSQAEQELLRAQSDLRHAMVKLKGLQAKVDRDETNDPPTSSVGSAEAEVEKAIQSDPVLLGYNDQEAQIKSTIEYARSIVRNPSDPSVTRPQKELIKLQQRRKQYEARLRSTNPQSRNGPLRRSRPGGIQSRRGRGRNPCPERGGARLAERGQQIHRRHEEAGYTDLRDGVDPGRDQ